MSLLITKNLSFTYNEAHAAVLSDVSVGIETTSKIGLHGINGSGKSTLARLLAGKKELLPGIMEGQIQAASETTVGYLGVLSSEQKKMTVTDFLWRNFPNLFRLKREINLFELGQGGDFDAYNEFYTHNGYDLEQKITRIMQSFDLHNNILSRSISTLSGGELLKINLVAVLVKSPDLMILDEPAGGLDIKGRAWLADFLKSSSIPFLVISHDREILRICNTIWEAKDGKISTWSMGYDEFVREKEEAFKLGMHLHEIQKRKIKKLKGVLKERRDWAASHQPQTGRNGAGYAYESITNGAKKAMKRAKNVEKRIELILEREEAEKPFVEKGRSLIFNDISFPGKRVLSLKNLSHWYEYCNDSQENNNKAQLLFSDINIDIHPQTRLGVAGPNGSGKTTLMKILSGELLPCRGEVKWSPSAVPGFFSQESLDLEPDVSAVDAVTGGNAQAFGFARTLLGGLGIRKDQALMKCKELSMGQKSKVQLARVILSGSNMLVLDEPAAHLELESRKTLTQALESFPGPVILITHDQAMLNEICDSVLLLGK